ncbi:hypothetical protein LSCM1_07292 [Leishmania martiniquensis]|uniref:Uncharacterized protein n=1 Tax=Leishmania martiniquensis TaxID=1580590 RepID=A0A836L278_9TRYP|nr:hypothetical protein LSCM1_07292 [Leishmania martiniquensis]
MSMQLFSFGHPCEHQLHRACIGGLNCPLNGYPDTWCCSFIKGKINFKRDRPCEGPRCFWDYVHPSQSQFDEVTQVLEQSRPIAAKLDESSDTDLLSFHISNPHIIDTVQCALHMMRQPPSVCARRVGQLLAYAAVLAGDQDVFVQLLKTMKKPVDGYILGAYAFLTQSKGGIAGGAGRGGSGAKRSNKRKDGKEDIAATLANIMVELMNAALSLGGQLVDREDQHVLQAMLIKALSAYPKSDRRHQDMLERAVAKFGHRRLEDEEEAAAERETAKREAASAASTAAAAAPPPTATTKQDAAGSCAATPVTATAGAGSAASAVAAGSSSAEPATREEATAAAVSRGPATATVTATADATAVPAVQAPSAAAGAPRTASRSGAAAAAAATAPGVAAEGTVKAAVPSVPPTAGEGAVAMVMGTGSAATTRVAGPSTPKPTASPVPGTPGLGAPSTPSVTAANTATAVAPMTPPTFSTAIAVRSPAAMAARPCSPAACDTTTAAPGGQPTAASAAPAVSPPPPARTAMVGISKLQPYLAARAAGMREEWPGVPPIYSPKSHASGLFICGGQFTVEPLVWNCAPLGDAAANRRLDTPTREYMRMKEENRRRQRAAREAHQACLAEIESGSHPVTSQRLQRTFSLRVDDSIDSWELDETDLEGSSSDFSFD